MKASTLMNRAEKHRKLMQDSLDEVRERISEILNSDDCDVLYQSTDGWVILFGEDSSNASVTFSEIDDLLKMDCEQAKEFLFSKSI